MVTPEGDGILTGGYESYSQQAELQGEERSTCLGRAGNCTHGNGGEDVKNRAQEGRDGSA